MSRREALLTISITPTILGYFFEHDWLMIWGGINAAVIVIGACIARMIQKKNPANTPSQIVSHTTQAASPIGSEKNLSAAKTASPTITSSASKKVQEQSPQEKKEQQREQKKQEQDEKEIKKQQTQYYLTIITQIRRKRRGIITLILLGALVYSTARGLSRLTRPVLTIVGIRTLLSIMMMTHKTKGNVMFFGMVMHIREYLQLGAVVIGILLFHVLTLYDKIFATIGLIGLILTILLGTSRFLIPRLRRRGSAKFWILRLSIWMLLIGFLVTGYQSYRYANDFLTQSFSQKQQYMQEYLITQGKNMRTAAQFFLQKTYGLTLPSRAASSSSTISEPTIASTTGLVVSTGSLVSGATGQDTTQPIVQSGTITTGTITTGQTDPALNFSGTGTRGQTILGSGEKDTTQPSSQIPEEHESSMSGQNNTKPISFRQAITSLVSSLPQTRKSYKFSLIATTDPDYTLFATARSLGMIGTDVDPAKSVPCKTYIVMKGLSQKRQVTITDPKNPFDSYRNEAKERNKLQGCVYGSLTTQANL